MNTHVAPHNLVSVSVFEDDHPCPKQQYHLVIYHIGSPDTPLKKNPDIQGDIYALETLQGSNWEEVVNESIKAMETRGDIEYRFATTSYNYSPDD